MSAQQEDVDATETERTARPGASGLVLDNVERWTELSLGLAQVAASYSKVTLEVAAGGEFAAAEASDEESSSATPETVDAADFIAVVPGAVATLGLRLQRRVFDAVAGAEALIATAMARAGAVKVTSPLARRVHGWLAELDAEFAVRQADNAAVASTFLAAAGPRTLDELLSRIDMEALLDRVDVDAVVDKVDMDLVLDKLDINEVMSGAIQDLQVTGLLRDSTGAIANTTVGVLRTGATGVASRITGRK